MKTIARIIFGSHLYGTNTPTSDTDFKSVHVPGAREILLQRVQDSTGHKVQRPEGEKNTPDAVDDESYSIQRYLNLLADGQTVAIDMLFAPQPIVTSELWEHIRANRNRLLSKRSTAFVGYCRTQANKYGIKGSRIAAAKAATEFFAGFLHAPGYGAQAKVRDVPVYQLADEHSRVVQQVCNRDGGIGTYFECCNRKVDFNASIKQAYEIFSRIYQNYGHRARLAQDNEGIDWKALSHAVRVGTEAIELLTTANITFPLPNAAHILEIKRGELSYDRVAAEIEDLLVAVEEASARSTLRSDADRNFIDNLVASVYRDAVLMESE